jgi:coenzyme F420-reducing hydrogenase delta subunit/Pyruvate/2-oxoacid:ferredoxin oxidoreductase delta subunit
MTENPVCILGNSACAWKIAAGLAAAGVGVLAATREGGSPPAAASAVIEACGERLEVLGPARLMAASGEPGRFELTFGGPGPEIRRIAAAVVVAEAPERVPAFAALGLTPAPGVLALSALDPGGVAGPEQAVFLNGLAGESDPATAAEVIRAAVRLQTGREVQCAVLTGNLKVAAEGAEALCEEARAEGVLFFKFQDTQPDIRQDGDGRVWIEFTDEVTGERLRLSPGLTVVEERCRPSAYTLELGRILGLETGPDGFLQADNVRRATVLTNRRGVFAAGGARAGGLDAGSEAANAVLEVLAALADAGHPAGESAAIDPGRCVRCLTCLRLCPHRAVALNGRPSVLPAACERCGLCAAECPRKAIRMPAMAHEAILARIAWGEPQPPEKPRIAAFCCRKSALPAAREAERAGGGLDAALAVIEVPCAAALPTELIVAAFGRGADGVIVLPCHEALCHAQVGTRFARARVAEAADILVRSGLPRERVACRTLAANMAREFAEAVSELARSLAALGH